MATPTVKLVADIRPALKDAFDRAARRHELTRRAAIEEALANWIEWANVARKGAKP